MSGFRCIALMCKLNSAYVELGDQDAAIELVSINEFFVYRSSVVASNKWVAVIGRATYIIWFDGSFYVREKTYE